ncbi:hypothetical protein Gpo141_00011574, partial [Globisporangium polare]
MRGGEQAQPCAASDARSGDAAPASRATPAAQAHGPQLVAASTPAYFSFKDYLSEVEAAQFFQLSHAAQVNKVAQYLDFLGKQPAAANFTTSSKASISFAATRASRRLLPVERRKDAMRWRVDADDEMREESDDASLDGVVILQELLEGQTRSGFGAFGTDDGFLPQKQLSLAVAAIIEEIGHEYIVERNKKGEIRAPVLNSRSFFFYWCHAEKQKIMDIRLQLDGFGLSRHHEHHRRRRRALWHRLVVVVDRAMCPDCIQFATC